MEGLAQAQKNPLKTCVKGVGANISHDLSHVAFIGCLSHVYDPIVVCLHYVFVMAALDYNEEVHPVGQ